MRNFNLTNRILDVAITIFHSIIISVKTSYIRKVIKMAFKHSIKEIRLNNRLSKVEMAKN